MRKDSSQIDNVIFWGAGATADLGLPTTLGQAKFIACLTGANDFNQPLEKRVSDSLGARDIMPWRSALIDLITILGDGDEANVSIDRVDESQMEAMRRNWQHGASDVELRRRIIELRLEYDWPALKAVVRICPGSTTGRFNLNDLFNLLDTHIPIRFGARSPVLNVGTSVEGTRREEFFDARRLTGAKSALLVVLIALFYIDYQICISSEPDLYRSYYDFAVLLGRRMQRQGLHLASQFQLDQPGFYRGDVGFASLNYDPIALWMQFVANRELNTAADVAHIGSPAGPLHLFHDFGHLIPARRIGRGEPNWPWYPLNEGAAQRLNGQGGNAKIRLGKFLFPHGCLCWRECPNCGKLSAFHGDQWDLRARGLFPPPPLRAFDPAPCSDWIDGLEREHREQGYVDARACLHCGILTFAHHTQVVMQSSFKSRPPSFIEEIQRDLRATTMQANHIIFMGYSLPPDDVTYRAFFSASCQRHRGAHKQRVYCTVVDKEPSHPSWYGPAELKTLTPSLKPDHAVNAAVDIFGSDNVRFFGGGVPTVFTDDAGRVTDDRIDRLLSWSAS